MRCRWFIWCGKACGLAFAALILGSGGGCQGTGPIGEYAVAEMRVFSDDGKQWLVKTLNELGQKPGNHIISVELSPEDSQIRILDRSSDGVTLRCERRVWYPFASDNEEYYSVPLETFGRRFAQIYEMCATKTSCRDRIHLAGASNPCVYYIVTTGQLHGFIADECAGAESVVRTAVIALNWRDEGPPYTIPATWDALAKHDCLSFATLSTTMVHAFDEMCRVYADAESRNSSAQSGM